MNLNICGEFCTNLANKQIGCEHVLNEHMDLTITWEKLCEFYESTLKKYKYKKILSCTNIDNKRADEYFFWDVVAILIWCFNFNVSIQTMYKAANYWCTSVIKKDIQDSVKKILFGQTWQMDRMIKICNDIDWYYSTDIFSSIAIRIHSLYSYWI